MGMLIPRGLEIVRCQPPWHAEAQLHVPPASALKESCTFIASHPDLVAIAGGGPVV